MAWTAPRTWVMGEIVTAAMMNTHVRANLRYLKGLDGTVAIDDAMTIAGALAVTGDITATAGARQLVCANAAAAFKGYFGINNSSLGLWDVNRNPATGTFDDTAKSHARIGLDGSGTTSFIQFLTANAANTTGTERMRITGAGNVGIGTTAPQGTLHGYESISGFMFYEFDGVDGTARTLLPNAAGNVTYGLVGHSVVRHSGGTTKAGTFSGGGGGAIVRGGTQNIYDDGTNIMQIQVNANGAVTVQRTAGTGTFKVRLLILWI